MSPTLQTVLTALGVGVVGTAGAVGPKVVNAMRRIGWLVDAICGTSTQPGVAQRVEQLTKDVAEIKARREDLLADGQAWGHRLDGQVADLDTRVAALEQGKDANPVVASRE